MAESTQALVFKLVIDGKEAQATLDLTKGEFIETGEAATAATEQIKKAYQGLTAEALKHNQVTEGNVASLTEYIKTQNLSVDIVEKTIQTLDSEIKTLSVNSEAWKKKTTASTNLKAALGGLMQQQTAYGQANQQTLPGVNSMRMAVQQFGYVLNDSQMFMVNARMGMMGIANNIPMIIQLFQAAKAEAGANASVMKLLTASITGGGGLIIGINALMLVMQLLPGLFDDTTESIDKQKDAVKKLKDEYEKLTREQIESRLFDLNKSLSEFEEKYPSSTESAFNISRVYGGLNPFYQQAISDKERFGNDAEEVNNLKTKISLLQRELFYKGDIEQAELRLQQNQQKLKDLNEENFDVIVTGAKSSKEAKETLEQWIEADKKLTEQKKKDDKEKDKLFKAATDRMELEQSHSLKMAEIEGKTDREILKMKKQQLVEQIKLYESYGKDVTALLYELAETEAELKTGKRIKLKAVSGPGGKAGKGVEAGTEEREKFLKQFEDDKLKELEIEETTALQRAETFANAEELKTKIHNYYARQRAELEREQLKNTISLISNTFGQLASIFGEHTAAYKILMVSKAIIDTYSAANVALASAPPPWNYIAMAAVIGTGLGNVDKILSVDVEPPKGFAKGGKLPKGKMGFVEGIHDEIIAPDADFKTAIKTTTAEAVRLAVMDARNYININQSSMNDFGEVKELLSSLKTQLDKGIKAIAVSSKRYEKEIYLSGRAQYRRSII